MPNRSLRYRLAQWFFPARASTQLWMLLTFAAFVGIAVLLVALYMTFILHGEIQSAMRETVQRQADRILTVVNRTDTQEDKLRRLRETARYSDLQIALASTDSVLIEAAGDRLMHDGAFWTRPEVVSALGGDMSLEVRETAGGESMLFAAVADPQSGMLLRIAQPEPPLFSTVQRMQVALIVGMIMALIMTLLGSWVAAHQVTTPLRSIRRAAQSIADGKLDKRIHVTSRAAELQDLAQSLKRAQASFLEKIKELERLTQLQSEFIGNVSHEVRNPIFAVGGYLEALSTPSLSEDMRKRYAEKGLVNLQRLNNLFNDLIEIAQLEYREDLISARVFDLQELVEEVSEMLEPKADEKELTLETENPHLLVEADRNRIRQVVTNLVENGIAYTDEGSVRCRFRRRADKVRIEIVDTGKGIPEDHLDRVFERFYRVDPDRSRKSGGTGLGLSIVKQILAAHGEQIHVESTPGRGTRFWFDLPYAGERKEEPAIASA